MTISKKLDTPSGIAWQLKVHRRIARRTGQKACRDFPAAWLAKRRTEGSNQQRERSKGANMSNLKPLILTAIISLLLLVSTAAGQTTAFTYQGKLTDSGNLANGNYDLQFKLFDALSAGTQLGTTQSLSPVAVTNGIFTVTLDFGACPTCFNGAARFLEIAVRPTGGGSFTTLSPRQPITSAPYALKSQTADGLSVLCVNCVTSSQIASVNGSAVTGTIPVASVPAGSGNYIQNGTSQQGGNFNINGTGTATILNAAMHYSLAGLRVFTVNGAYSGSLGTFTASNTFTGEGAGLNTTPSSTLNDAFGKFNAFFGAGAGQTNTTGFRNAFFGAKAGQLNISDRNAFFGAQAGQANTTGDQNAFFGTSAGEANTTACCNAFFGATAGQQNTTGDQNAFFGAFAGNRNISGVNNTFIGTDTNFNGNNPTGNNNTLLGYFARVNADVSNGTAIGFRALVTQSNSLILGSINGPNSADTLVGIGTTSPGAVLDVQRDGGTIPETVRFTTFGTANEILSRLAGGTRAAPAATPNGTFLLQLGATGHDGANFVATPAASINMDTAEAWTPTANGTQIRFRTTLNGTASSAIATRMIILNDGKVGIGTSAPADRLHVNGILRVETLGDVDQMTTSLCRNGSHQIATCNASSLRYKTALQPFTRGLEIVNHLRPITFTWKQSGMRDLGFAAEEVEKVEPLFTFTNDKGEVEGVKYDRLSVVLVNAVKELKQENDQLKQKLSEQQAQFATQQQQFSQQQQQITQQQQEMAAVKKLLCASQPQADLCRAKSLK
jgi:hypothetical protein